MTAEARRSLVLALVLGLILAPAAVDPQPLAKVARIGYLSTAGGRGPYIGAVQEGLRELGWVEGQNVISEYRGADGKVDRLAGLALDFVRSKVDVIVAMETPAAHAAKEVSGSIPVVFATSDPRKLVGNLARPGGNLTGVTNIGTDIAGKQLELLKGRSRRPPGRWASGSRSSRRAIPARSTEPSAP